MIRQVRLWLYRQLRKLGINWWNLRPRPRLIACRGGILSGGFASSFNHELYTRPDKDNPAREWWKQGQTWEQLEKEGKTKKLDDWDGRKAQIESWQNVGYEL